MLLASSWHMPALSRYMADFWPASVLVKEGVSLSCELGAASSFPLFSCNVTGYCAKSSWDSRQQQISHHCTVFEGSDSRAA